jgi:hypothetical protein
MMQSIGSLIGHQRAESKAFACHQSNIERRLGTHGSKQLLKIEITEKMRASEASNLVFCGFYRFRRAWFSRSVRDRNSYRVWSGRPPDGNREARTQHSGSSNQQGSACHHSNRLGMGVLVFLLTNLLVGMGAKESFIFAIGIIVALVPEGLLPTVTLALAFRVKRIMLFRQASPGRSGGFELHLWRAVCCAAIT